MLAIIVGPFALHIAATPPEVAQDPRFLLCNGPLLSGRAQL